MKRRTMRYVIALAAVTAMTLGLTTYALGRASSPSSAKLATIPAFTAADLTALPAENWIAPGGNIQDQRHSALKTINTDNVTTLKQAWHVSLTAPNVGDQPDEHGGESSSVAYKGILYTEDQFGRVFATDGDNGNYLWVFEPNNAANYSGPCASPGSCYPNGKPIDMSKAPANIVATATYIQTQDGGCGLGCTGITAHTVVAATRGAALGGGMVFVGETTTDTVFAIDAKSGRQVWATTVANNKDGSSISIAPVYFDGKVFMATSGGDRGASCIVFALDAKTGQPLWHFNLIPTQKSQPGYETWTHPLPYNGGAAVWNTVAQIDPVAKLVYVGTGNPLPYSPVVRGPGKEYYTVGEVALHTDTGKLAWFFQAVHHDAWDADQSQAAILFDGKYKGTLRHGIVFANKDGLWYVLDRVTGAPLLPVTEVPVQQDKEANTFATQPIPATDPLVQQCPPGSAADWAGLTAPDGKPFNQGTGLGCSFTAITSKNYSITAAFGHGAAAQRPASVDPTSMLYYNESSPGFNAYKSDPASEITLLQGGRFSNEKSGSLAGTPAGAATVNGSRLGAYSLLTGKMVWTVDHMNAGGSAPFSAGTTTTDGNLLFTVSHGALQAYNSQTGALLWQSGLLGSGSGLTSAPMTYTGLDGNQYVAIYKDNTSDFYGFKLG